MHRYVQLHVILCCFGFFGVSGKRGLSGVTKEFEGELWEALEGHFWTWLSALTVYPHSS